MIGRYKSRRSDFRSQGYLIDRILHIYSLTLIGSDDESVVLCSKTKTYSFQEAEISNSLLLLPDFKFSKETKSDLGSGRILKETEVRGVFYIYFEVNREKKKMFQQQLIGSKFLLS